MVIWRIGLGRQPSAPTTEYYHSCKLPKTKRRKNGRMTVVGLEPTTGQDLHPCSTKRATTRETIAGCFLH